MAGLVGLAAAALVAALVVAQPWSGDADSAPQPADAPSGTETAEPTGLAVVGSRTYADGDVVMDEVEFCKTGTDCASDDGVVTATVRLTVSGDGWTAYTDDEVSTLASGDDQENWAAVSWTPLRGWVPSEYCSPGRVGGQETVPVSEEGSADVPGLTFGSWKGTTIGGRPARETTLELGDLCPGVDAWILASSGTAESLSRVRVADGPGSLTIGIVPIPEAGPGVQLAFYDFNGDDHKRTRAQLREREQIRQSLSITVE